MDSLLQSCRLVDVPEKLGTAHLEKQPKFTKIATTSRAPRPWTRESEREKESVLRLVTD